MLALVRVVAANLSLGKQLEVSKTVARTPRTGNVIEPDFTIKYW